MKFIKISNKTLSLFLILLTFLSLFCDISTKSIMKQNLPFNRQTEDNDWGSNNIYYLDRHNINCNPNEAIQGFRLYRSASNKITYKYNCKTNQKLISGKTFYDDKTKENIIGKDEHKSANYLDKHDVQCKKGYALQGFKLNRSGKKIYYSYRCVEVSCGNKLTKTTNPTDDGGFSTIYLDRQNVSVGKDEIITGFKLISKDRNFQYEINYCKLTKDVPLPEIPKEILSKEKSSDFCKENCQSNPNGERKKCKFEDNLFICRRCEIKSSINDSDKKIICETFCDSKENDDKTCIFFGFMNDSKKIVDPKILQKFGLLNK